MEQSHWSLELTVWATSENNLKTTIAHIWKYWKWHLSSISPIGKVKRFLCSHVRMYFIASQITAADNAAAACSSLSFLYRCIVTTSSSMPRAELLTSIRHWSRRFAKHPWQREGRVEVFGQTWKHLLRCPIWNMEWKQTVLCNGNILAVTDNG